MLAGDTRWPDEVIDETVEITLEPELRLKLANRAGVNNGSSTEEIIALLSTGSTTSHRGPLSLL